MGGDGNFRGHVRVGNVLSVFPGANHWTAQKNKSMHVEKMSEHVKICPTIAQRQVLDIFAYLISVLIY